MPSLPDASVGCFTTRSPWTPRKTLWFVADAQDVTALDNQNAVCLAYGAGFENFRDAEPFLSAFPSVFLALSDRETAEAVADALKKNTRHLWPCCCRRKGPSGDVPVSGRAGFRREKGRGSSVAGRRGTAMDGLLDLADVERRDPGASVAVMSGLKALDQSIGGFAPSELSVWTGKRGSGKSTLLSQLLLNAIDQGFPVCAYSGSCRPGASSSGLCCRPPGPDISSRSGTRCPGSCITTRRRRSRTGSTVGGRESFPVRQPGGWCWGRGQYHFRVQYAVRRFGCCVFLCGQSDDRPIQRPERQRFYRAQSRFTGRLVEFAKKNEVHVHLVAHPGRATTTKEAADRGRHRRVGGHQTGRTTPFRWNGWKKRTSRPMGMTPG